MRKIDEKELSEKGASKNERIIPPMLFETYQEFLSLYKSQYSSIEAQSKKIPLMIIGPPGVGKTFFFRTFEQLYKEAYDISDDKIRRLNVAAIPKDLIESILFGHMKGAFTDAKTETSGFVEVTEGGILILEEIGEIPQEIQAKLLTFIEDGQYYKVGGTDLQESKGTQIVATTNKMPNDEVFRQDFLDRFFPFYISPLHNRRKDILYHWAHLFPDMLDQMDGMERLAIMAYHWPGNIREIERIGHLLRWSRQHKESNPSHDQASSNFWHKSGYSGLNLNECHSLYIDLKVDDVDVDFLQRELIKRGVSLRTAEGGKIIPLKFRQPNQELKAIEEKLNIKICAINKSLDRLYEGLLFYCDLFRLNPSRDQSLLDISSLTREEYYSVLLESFHWPKDKYTKLRESIIHHIEQKFKVRSPERGRQVESDIFTMSENELLRYYYEGILQKTHGNQSKAAKVAKLHLSTFRDHCKKCGIP